MTNPQDSKDSQPHSGRNDDCQKPIPKDCTAHCRPLVPPLEKGLSNYFPVLASTESVCPEQTGSTETSPRRALGGYGSPDRTLGSWSRQGGLRHSHGVEGLAVANHHQHAEEEEVNQRRDWKHIDLHQDQVRGNWTQLVASSSSGSGSQPAAGSVNVPGHNCGSQRSQEETANQNNAKQKLSAQVIVGHGRSG